MSAHVVNQAHLDVLVTAAVFGSGDARGHDPDEVGRMLLRANVQSVNARYREADPLGLEPGDYAFQRTSPQPPLVVLRVLGYYEYQACEHPDWTRSEAHRFCQALRHRLVEELPGYRDALSWGSIPEAPYDGARTM